MPNFLIDSVTAELLINVPDLLTGILGAIIIGLFVVYKKKILYGFDKYKYISKQVAGQIEERHSLNFVPNRLSVNNEIHTDGVKYFYDNVFTKDGPPLHIIIAPTGVGKTTFLANLYLKRNQYNKGVKVAFGIMYHADTIKVIQKLIDNGYAKDTILLIDALDELTIPAADSPQAYWSQFVKDYHKFINEQAIHFKKVVLTIREQFLQTNELFNKSIQIGMDKHPPKYVHLLPFNAEQQDEYLNLRYRKTEENTLLGNLKWLADRMRKRNLSFVEIPLVLNYLEEVFKVYTPNNQEYFFTSYNILNIIVESWLSREEGKGVPKEQLRNFCSRLAYEIARQSEPGFSKLISAKELIAFEASMGVLDDFSGWGDRSLLIKDVVGAGIRFGFVNDTILEFFLVVYLNAAPEKELDVPLEHFDIAIQLLVAQRWPDLKRRGVPEISGTIKSLGIPKNSKLANIFISALNLEGDEDDNLFFSYEDLIKWANFFDSLFQSVKVQDRMSRGGFLTNVLKVVDPEWRPQIDEISGLGVFNINFWDDETQSPKEGVEKAYRYLSDYITSVFLYEINIREEDLSCIKDAMSISDLNLFECNIASGALKYIAASKNNLERIILSNCNVSDEHLLVFSGFKNISNLTLPQNNIIGQGLRSFSHSAKSLTDIILTENQIQDEYLDAFYGSDKIQFINLESNKIRGKGLANFRMSNSTLRDLVLSHNEIEDEYIEIFSGANKLIGVSVNNNKLTKKGLMTFLASKDTLTSFILSGNNFSQLDYADLSSKFRCLHTL